MMNYRNLQGVGKGLSIQHKTIVSVSLCNWYDNGKLDTDYIDYISIYYDHTGTVKYFKTKADLIEYLTRQKILFYKF